MRSWILRFNVLQLLCVLESALVAYSLGKSINGETQEKQGVTGMAIWRHFQGIKEVKKGREKGSKNLEIGFYIIYGWPLKTSSSRHKMDAKQTIRAEKTDSKFALW